MNDILKDAFLDYALGCDLEMVSEFWQRCEDLADQLTELLTLMARHRMEDGNIPPGPSKIELSLLHKLNGTIDSRKWLVHVAGPSASPENLKELGWLEMKCNVLRECRQLKDGEIRNRCQQIDARRFVCEQYVLVINNGLTKIETLEDKCSTLTWRYLMHLYRPFRDYLGNEKICPLVMPIKSIPPAETWREMRRMLWAAADTLHGRTKDAQHPCDRRGRPYSHPTMTAALVSWATPPHKRRGRPYDYLTGDLLTWAASQELTHSELARMLVEADLDRDRTGTKAARIRAEKKRLSVHQDNRDKKQAALQLPSA